eukprot:Sdes_comp9343_c0_seq1m819
MKTNSARVRTSFVLCKENEFAHRFGVNSLALHSENETVHLFSAGRDSIIRKWKISLDASGKVRNHEPVCSLEGHSDWVNSISIGNFPTLNSAASSLLFSASSDGSLKVWDIHTSSLISTLTDHQDYIKCVVSSPLSHTFSSAGFDKKINIYDISAQGIRPSH